VRRKPEHGAAASELGAMEIALIQIKSGLNDYGSPVIDPLQKGVVINAITLDVATFTSVMRGIGIVRLQF
jgi:hypothetical protein